MCYGNFDSALSCRGLLKHPGYDEMCITTILYNICQNHKIICIQP